MAFFTMETEIFKDIYGSREMRAIFEEENYLQSMLNFEVALAKAQSGLGMIPASAAEEIARKGTTRNVSLQRVAEINRQIQLYTVAVVRAFAEVCDDGAGEYIHYGATSQDLIETALVSRVKDAMDVLEKKLSRLLQVMLELAKQHKDTVIAARTHGQQALPTTFGFLMAGYADMVYQNLEKLRESRKRVLVGSCSGAVGAGQSFKAVAGDAALQLEEQVMQILGLGAPVICPQPNNARWTELLNLLACIGQTFEKIGEDLYTMQRTELNEIAEPFDTANQICSSTMPQKRNPIYAEMMPPFAKKLMSNAHAMMSTHHRDARHFTPLYMFDLLIPESFVLTDTLLEAALFIFSGISVNSEGMKKNLHISGGLITSEALLFALARKTGKKQTSMEIVHRLAMHSFENDIPFSQACATDEEVAKYFSMEEVEDILRPENYTGFSAPIVDKVIEKYSSQ